MLKKINSLNYLHIKLYIAVLTDILNCLYLICISAADFSINSPIDSA
jgi:hypothetical protein